MSEEAKRHRKKMTKKQALNRRQCPRCRSKDIDSRPSGCLCRIEGHSCWSHPVCNDCGFTAGSGAGNSGGGIWVTFAEFNDTKWPANLPQSEAK